MRLWSCGQPPSDAQGCSTLSTDTPLGQSIESGESGRVSVLAERSGLIATQNIIAKTAYPGEYTWIATDVRFILLEGDIARVVQRIFDMPMASDGAEIGRAHV